MKMQKALLLTFSLLLTQFGFSQVDKLINLNSLSNPSVGGEADFSLQKKLAANFSEEPKDTVVQKEDTAKVEDVNDDSLKIAEEREYRMNNIYGKKFFENGNLKIFKSATHLKAPDDYILGPGDELNVSIWGYASVSENLKIADDGAVYPKIVGKIYLNGLSMGEASKLLQAKFGSVYDLKNSQIAVSLNYSKVIQVNIVGEVVNPGSYSISSLNSAFNVLSIAGGLTNLASVRNILIKRDNKVVKVLDVYKFLQDPSFSNDYFLKSNDYIVVQPKGKVVIIEGAIGREGMYELAEGEDFKELIKYAGGLSYDAYTDYVNIERTENNLKRSLDIDLKRILNDKASKIEIKNGDKINIRKIDGDIRNYVEVEGAVFVPGRYQFSKGDRVSDLLRKSKGIKYYAYTGRAYILRTYPHGEKKYFKLNLDNVIADTSSSDNYELAEFDLLKVFSTNDFHDEFSINIQGAVRHPAEVPYTENLTLQDMIFYAGGLRPDAANKRIEVSRMVNYSDNNLNDDKVEIVVETYEVTNDLSFDKLKEIKVKPLDRIFVRSVAEFQKPRYVTLVGEVKYPGEYVLLNSKETISEVVARAGGFTDAAFLEGATMIRQEGSKGKLVIDLPALYKRKEKQYDYVMLSGDSLVIPKIEWVVVISGDVGSDMVLGNKQQNAPFTKGKRAKFYIKEYAGGFTKSSNRNGVYVIGASGKMKKSANFLLFKVYPKVRMGDRVLVDTKPPKKDNTEPVDVGKVIGDITAKVTGVLTLIVLFNKVF